MRSASVSRTAGHGIHGRGRTILAAILVVSLAAIALPAVATGDVAPAAKRNEAQKLTASTRQGNAEFGLAVAVDGDRLFVGEPFADIIYFPNSGRLHGFDRTDSTWSNDPSPVYSYISDSEFGWSLALEGDTLVVGAPAAADDDGRVLIFERDGSEWVREQTLLPNGSGQYDSEFGRAVDICGDRLIVGAPKHTSEGAAWGAAYVFARDGSTWEAEDRFYSSDPATDDRFGWSVAIDGDRALVGARGSGSRGAAYMFSRSGSEWSQDQKLVPSDDGGWFGTSVDLDGATALIGATQHDGSRGAAYVFVRVYEGWLEQQKLSASDGNGGDTFGNVVVVEGDTAIVGASADDEKGAGAGSAYVFDRVGSDWTQRDKLLASDGASLDFFGGSASASGDTAVIGAWGENSFEGAAYVFDGILGPYDAVELAGATRYETAIAASKEAFPDGAGTVIVATGENWPDALGGAALAGAYDAPILLTLTSTLPAAVSAEINRLGATEIVILGGPGAVAPAVETALASGLGPSHVRRIGGATRYDTADLIARAVKTKVGDNYDGTCFVATGTNFPDALAGSPLAAAGPWPILLAPPTGMTPSTLATMSDIGVSDVLILGGHGVVSQAIEDGLALGVSGDVTRLAGPTRYETAVEAASYGVDEARLRWNGVALATGENFPDALAGGPLQGRKRSVMLLTHTASLTPSTAQVLQDEERDIAAVRFLGGTGALSQAVRDSVEAILE